MPQRTVLSDRSLTVDFDAELARVVLAWLPIYTAPMDGAHTTRARITVAIGDVKDRDPPPGEPTMTWKAVRVWTEATPDRAWLTGTSGASNASIDFSALRAEVAVSRPDPSHDVELHIMLVVIGALLLSRLGRALVHSAAIVSPAGQGVLLVGDSRSGKSTTCANLMRGGWHFVSDDSVVLFRTPDGKTSVEGWPREMHLDSGWTSGVPDRIRRDVDPATVGSAPWVATSPVHRMIFPTIATDGPTRLVEVTSGDALAALIRQSPWLLADRAAAAEALSLLTEVSSLPTHRLLLAPDTLQAPGTLARVLDG